MSGSSEPPTDHAILLCPPQSQTSPTSTSSKAIRSASLVTRIVRDSKDACIGSSVTTHLPSFSATADFCCPAKCTATDAPGVVQPQTFTGLSRCNTIPSPKSFETVSSARLACAKTNNESIVMPASNSVLDRLYTFGDILFLLPSESIGYEIRLFILVARFQRSVA